MLVGRGCEFFSSLSSDSSMASACATEQSDLSWKPNLPSFDVIDDCLIESFKASQSGEESEATAEIVNGFAIQSFASKAAWNASELSMSKGQPGNRRIQHHNDAPNEGLERGPTSSSGSGGGGGGGDMAFGGLSTDMTASGYAFPSPAQRARDPTGKPKNWSNSLLNKKVATKQGVGVVTNVIAMGWIEVQLDSSEGGQKIKTRPGNVTALEGDLEGIAAFAKKTRAVATSGRQFHAQQFPDEFEDDDERSEDSDGEEDGEGGGEKKDGRGGNQDVRERKNTCGTVLTLSSNSNPISGDCQRHFSVNEGVECQLENQLVDGSFPWGSRGRADATDVEVLLYTLLLLCDAKGTCRGAYPFKAVDTFLRGRVAENPVNPPSIRESTPQAELVVRPLSGREEKAPVKLTAEHEIPFQQLSTGAASLFREAKRQQSGTQCGEQPQRASMPSIAASVPGQFALFSQLLASDCPRWCPVGDCVASRLITDTSSELDLADPHDASLIGQRELFAKDNIPKGRLVPWVSRYLRVLGEPSATENQGTAVYEFQFKWGKQTLISTPDLRAATPFGNDFCGPSRTADRRRRLQYRQNTRFCVIFDAWRRPYVCLMATKDIRAGSACWLDYGDSYWENWHLDRAAIASAHARYTNESPQSVIPGPRVEDSWTEDLAAKKKSQGAVSSKANSACSTKFKEKPNSKGQAWRDVNAACPTMHAKQTPTEVATTSSQPCEEPNSEFGDCPVTWVDEALAVLGKLMGDAWLEGASNRITEDRPASRFCFCTPVEVAFPEMARHYRFKIAYPMDLGTVQAMLKRTKSYLARTYSDPRTGGVVADPAPELCSTPLEFCELVVRVFANAIEYNYGLWTDRNMVPFEICRAANFLGGLFEALVLESSLADTEQRSFHGSVQCRTEISGARESVGKWYRMELSASARHSRRFERECVLIAFPISELGKGCSKLLKSMSHGKIMKRHTWRFEEPIDLVANPTYATVVKAEPTSTSQCSDKLNRSLRFDGRGSAGEIQIYETVGTFVADLKAVYDNALTFNTPGENVGDKVATEFCDSARALRGRLQEKVVSWAFDVWENSTRQQTADSLDRCTTLGPTHVATATEHTYRQTLSSSSYTRPKTLVYRIGPRHPDTQVSMYEGVSRAVWQNKWQAKIGSGDAQSYLGTFDSEKAAASAYSYVYFKLLPSPIWKPTSPHPILNLTPNDLPRGTPKCVKCGQMKAGHLCPCAKHPPNGFTVMFPVTAEGLGILAATHNNESSYVAKFTNATGAKKGVAESTGKVQLGDFFVAIDGFGVHRLPPSKLSHIVASCHDRHRRNSDPFMAVTFLRLPLAHQRARIAAASSTSVEPTKWHTRTLDSSINPNTAPSTSMREAMQPEDRLLDFRQSEQGSQRSSAMRRDRARTSSAVAAGVRVFNYMIRQVPAAGISNDPSGASINSNMAPSTSMREAMQPEDRLLDFRQSEQGSQRTSALRRDRARTSPAVAAGVQVFNSMIQRVPTPSVRDDPSGAAKATPCVRSESKQPQKVCKRSIEVDSRQTLNKPLSKSKTLKKRNGPVIEVGDLNSFIGRTIQKRFGAHGLFKGWVKRVTLYQFFRIEYEDGDEEDISLDELVEHLLPIEIDSSKRMRTSDDQSVEKIGGESDVLRLTGGGGDEDNSSMKSEGSNLDMSSLSFDVAAKQLADTATTAAPPRSTRRQAATLAVSASLSDGDVAIARLMEQPDQVVEVNWGSWYKARILNQVHTGLKVRFDVDGSTGLVVTRLVPTHVRVYQDQTMPADTSTEPLVASFPAPSTTTTTTTTTTTLPLGSLPPRKRQARESIHVFLINHGGDRGVSRVDERVNVLTSLTGSNARRTVVGILGSFDAFLKRWQVHPIRGEPLSWASLTAKGAKSLFVAPEDISPAEPCRVCANLRCRDATRCDSKKKISTKATISVASRAITASSKVSVKPVSTEVNRVRPLSSSNKTDESRKVSKIRHVLLGSSTKEQSAATDAAANSAEKSGITSEGFGENSSFDCAKTLCTSLDPIRRTDAELKAISTVLVMFANTSKLHDGTLRGHQSKDFVSLSEEPSAAHLRQYLTELSRPSVMLSADGSPR